MSKLSRYNKRSKSNYFTTSIAKINELKIKFFTLFMSHKNTAISNYKITIDSNNRVRKLNNDLYATDQKIIELTNKLLAAEVLKVNSYFNKNQNFINRIRSNYATSRANESTDWNKERLMGLIQKRKQIQLKLEHITGQYWKHQIIRIIFIISILFFLAIIGLFFIFSLFAALYLLPLWGGLAILYLWLSSRKNVVNRSS